MSGSRGVRASKRSARWTDMRLWLGLVLILGSMFAGAYLLSAGEQTITVWRAAANLAVGDAPVVEPISVRLDDSALAYIPASSPPLGRMRVPVAVGALLPAAAVGAGEPATGRLITVAVDSLHAPVGLDAGDVVDVWVTAGDANESSTPALILAQAHVQAVDRDNLGVGGEIPVVLAIDRERVAPIIAASSGKISLVEVPFAAQSSGADDRS
ncbi:MAG: hypothetical protein Q7K25_03160 [Actinomycetota bacterium]|nr:hypothetical protein [Actinomycetota bacterium]